MQENNQSPQNENAKNETVADQTPRLSNDNLQAEASSSDQEATKTLRNLLRTFPILVTPTQVDPQDHEKGLDLTLSSSLPSSNHQLLTSMQTIIKEVEDKSKELLCPFPLPASSVVPDVQDVKKEEADQSLAPPTEQSLVLTPDRSLILPPDQSLVPPPDQSLVPPLDQKIIPPDQSLIPPLDQKIIPPDQSLVPPPDQSFVPPRSPSSHFLIGVKTFPKDTEENRDDVKSFAKEAEGKSTRARARSHVSATSRDVSFSESPNRVPSRSEERQADSKDRVPVRRKSTFIPEAISAHEHGACRLRLTVKEYCYHYEYVGLDHFDRMGDPQEDLDTIFDADASKLPFMIDAKRGTSTGLWEKIRNLKRQFLIAIKDDRDTQHMLEDLQFWGPTQVEFDYLLDVNNYRFLGKIRHNSTKRVMMLKMIPRKNTILKYLEDISRNADGSKLQAHSNTMKKLSAMAKNELIAYKSIKRYAFIQAMSAHYKTDICYYFVLEFFNGCSLEHALQEGFSLTSDNKKFILIQLALAIHYLHEKGVIHRNITPQNIIVNSDWQMKLTSFESSKVLSVTTKEVPPLLTIAYAAPELLMNAMGRYESSTYSVAVDWWSYGIVTFRLFTGTLPVEIYCQSKGYSYEEMGYLERVGATLRAPVDQVSDTLSPSEKDFILSFLNLNPKQRLPYTEGLGFNAVKKHDFFANCHTAFKEAETVMIRTRRYSRIGSLHPY